MSAWLCLWVGESGPAFVQEGVRHYLKRIRPWRRIENVLLRGAAHSGRTPELALRKEGEALLRRLRPEDRLIALDPSGAALDTIALAQAIQGWEDNCTGRLVFVVGGAWGLAEAVRQRAHAMLSLSAMTFPHALVRLMLLEQLYRALSWNRGLPYHHA